MDVLKLWTLTTFLLASLLLFGKAQFLVEPVSVTMADGLETVFECQYQAEEGFEADYDWAIDNNLVLTDTPTAAVRLPPSVGGIATLTILATAQYNNSVIQCVALVRDGIAIVRSEVATNATLTIQKTLITKIMNAATTITVTWSAVPQTEYCVNINRTTANSSEAIILDPVCSITDHFNFNYTGSELCDRFSFIVTPTDGGKRGTTSEPETGLFTRAQGQYGDDLVSENGVNKSVTFTFTVPNCAIFISYQVVSNLLPAPVNQSIIDPSLFNGSLNFSLPTDNKGTYDIILKDMNETELVFENIPITTFDVQDVILSDNFKNGIDISIMYVEGTLSPGALVCVLPRINGDLDFASMTLVAIPRNKSDNFTIPVPSGEYSVVVFDLENENETVPRMPSSQAADTKNKMVESVIENTTSPPPSSEDITVTVLSSNDVQITCPEPHNCLALIQSSSLLNNKTFFAFVNSSANSTSITVDDSVDNNTYVVVYSWGRDESVFNGAISHIEQLYSFTTSSPTPITTSDHPTSISDYGPLQEFPTGAIAGIIAVLIFVLTVILIILVFVCFIKNARHKNKVLRISYSRAKYISTSSHEVDIGASITSTKIAAIYDVARAENMSPKHHDNDTPPPAYDVVRQEHMAPQYETVEAAKAAAIKVQGAATTVQGDAITVEATAIMIEAVPEMASLKPPPPPPPMIRAENESPSLPPPYDPAVDEIDNEESVESHVDSTEQVKVDESLEAVQKDSLNTNLEVDTCGAVANCYDKVHLPIEQERLSQNNETNHSGHSDESTDKEETKIATQHQYTEVQSKPSVGQTTITDHTKVVYAQVDKKKLKAVDPDGPPPPLPPRTAPPPPPPTPESLLTYLGPISSRWEDFAKALDYDEDKTDEIFTNNENDFLRLHEFVQLYFMNVHFSHSWAEVEKALRKMGENTIAGRVHAENMQGSEVPQFSSLV